jgi:archaellum component FlaC
MTAKEIEKRLHQAIAPLFEEISKEIAVAFNKSKAISAALEKIEQLQAEIKALRKEKSK